MTALLFWCLVAVLPAAAWSAYARWSERRWIAKAQREEHALAEARAMNAKAAQVLAQLERETMVAHPPVVPVIEHRISDCQPVEQALDVYLALIGHPVQSVEVER